MPDYYFLGGNEKAVSQSGDYRIHKREVIVAQIRILYYLNQFFAGIGGEEKADVPVGSREGALGPGKRLQDLLGDSANIVVTAYCGDNYFAGHTNEALEGILQIAREHDVKMLVAGPAFASGRYGFTCVEVCHSVSTSLGLDCVTGMHVENPGVDRYRQYKDRRVWLFPTAEGVAGMEDALSKMAQCVSKLAVGSVIGTASDEGYIPRGFRAVEVTSKTGVERAIDMLLDKAAGQPFAAEIPVESLEEIPIAPPITNLADVCLALVTTSGVVPAGNPDGFKQHRNTEWRKYSVENLNSMKDSKWDVRHGGYDNAFMLDNPNYGVPLDACREMESEGVFARLYPYFYSTPGTNGLISVMQRIGKEMVSDMKAESVNAVLLVAT